MEDQLMYAPIEIVDALFRILFFGMLWIAAGCALFKWMKRRRKC